MTGVKKPVFDAWMADSDRKTKPFADYARVKAADRVEDPAGQVLHDVKERKAARRAADRRKKADMSAEDRRKKAGNKSYDLSGIASKDKMLPVGKGTFGDVYDGFNGKAIEAFYFLASKRDGDLLGVFHREGLGDIDVVWGDGGGGLGHIISKHVGEGKSFTDVDEAANVIDDIIKTGSSDFWNGDKIVFRKGSKIVTIRKNVREKDSRQELDPDGL